MKTMKRVLAILCIVLLIADICVGNNPGALAEEFLGTGDNAIEEVQPTEKALDETDAAATDEKNVKQAEPEKKENVEQAEPEKKENVEQAEPKEEEKVGAEVKETEEKQASEASTAADTPSDKAQNETDQKESEDQDENVKESKDEEPEPFVQTMKYEDDDVKVHVTAVTKDAIPENATLKVVPIVEKTAKAGMTAEKIKEINDINNQYKEVEKKLIEKAEDEAYDIAGFLAYDITFVDKDGKKVEPNGEVKVSMDYKKAVIPEEAAKADAETTDVTVMHFEEDANGQVKEIVDMVADESKEAAVQTTENAEVEKTEFVTDSFSTFTLTWRNAIKRVTVHRVDTNGKEIGPEVTNNPNEYQYDEAISLQTLGNDYRPDGYTFVKGCINRDLKTEISEIKYGDYEGKGDRQNNCWQYMKSDQNRWTKWNDNSKHVYLVYEQIKPVEQLNTVATVDSTALGVTMRMVNFDGRQTDIGGPWVADMGRTPGLLTSTVGENGYPSSIQGSVDFENWFGEGASGDKIVSSQEVNHLFLKSVYDETGYFSYSSFDNYAYLNQSTGDFTVYDAIGTPTGDYDLYYYKRGNFLPYNNIVPGKVSRYKNAYSPDGNPLQQGDKGFGRDLYLAQETIDYNFGLYIEANFAQAKDGKYNGSPMRFNFNGDDDLWVYIDGVLVLDIGGIHDAQSGYIDFQTGKVHVTPLSNGTGTDTTIKRMFDDAKQDTSTGFTGDTFSDYSSHKIQIFYMERGEGASNLQMSFNLPVIPEGTVEVTKELKNTDKEKYTDVEFAFQLCAQKKTGEDEQGNEIYSNEYEPISGACYKDTDTLVKYNETENINGTEYKKVFYLKPGQTAQFKGLQANRKYYVKEIGVKSEEYDHIYINGTEYEGFDDNQQGSGRIADFTAPEEMVSKRHLVVFTNNCSGANSNELQITKQMAGGLNTEDKFTFKVELENQSGQLAPYSGAYYLLDKDGKYCYYDDNGDLQSGETSKVCGTTENGEIRGIPAGHTVVLTGLLSGTDFKVTETGLATAKYMDPKKDLQAGTYDEKDLAEADGKIALGPDAKMTITNDMRQDIAVEKRWTDGDHANDTVYAGLYTVDENAAVQPVENKYVALSSSNNWQDSFTKLSHSKTWEVKELRPVRDGETPDFTIETQGYVPIEKNEVIRINDKDYKVTYEEQKNGDNAGNTKIIITNARLSTLKINKVKAGNDSIKLEGAEFKLQMQKQVNDQLVFEDVMKDGKVYTVTTDKNGNAGFEGLEEGTYQLVETKAPVGYSLLRAPIQITLAYEDTQDDGVTPIDGSGATVNGKTVYYDVTQTVENIMLYELPSAGGSGIYWYSIGGVLFMMAAALILYKNKRKEVLRG